ncbi:histidine phosphatase family protein [Thermogymnomonas acidicola]|uniref:Histidine phosphatase family protein n=2 Tax=Thermogymnomonas acidicola TaxID=399579 RepID=A0AA37BRN1_9ARCH|nr:histidine phosphatase family protein [Thermogymnomonas acidicola]GGM75338.1 histidine phosphatase family protein [Thermogymnomonas acidicola]
MALIALVRHGESEANVLNIVTHEEGKYHLTERGREQALFISRTLAGLGFRRVYSSPLLRTVETAEIIASHLGLSVEVDARLRETDMGPYAGMRADEIPWGPREEMPIESWASHVERMHEAIDSMSEASIVVSHAFPIRAYLASVMGLGEEESYGIEVRNASLSVVDNRTFEVIAIGSFVLSGRVRKLIIERNSMPAVDL